MNNHNITILINDVCYLLRLPFYGSYLNSRLKSFLVAIVSDKYLFYLALFFAILKHWEVFPKYIFKRKISTKSSNVC